MSMIFRAHLSHRKPMPVTDVLHAFIMTIYMQIQLAYWSMVLKKYRNISTASLVCDDFAPCQSQAIAYTVYLHW